MWSTRWGVLFFVASALIAVTVFQDACGLVNADTFLGPPSLPFVPRSRASLSSSAQQQLSLLVEQIRGGAASATAIDVEIESSDDEEEEEVDDEEEEDEDTPDPKLARAAQAAVSKVKSKATKVATEAAKAAVTATLLKSKTQKTNKSKSSLIKFFHIPYIIKACLNPFLLFQMTKGYWASLFNIKYLSETQDSSQDLRSALEQKARKGGGGNQKRGKKTMKPGQARTLADLPQLNT